MEEMEETERVVWPVSWKRQRYPFPIPTTVADSIERASSPVWERYKEDSGEAPSCALLDALEGWWLAFSAMLSILEDLAVASSEGSQQLYGLHYALKAMGEDLIDIIVFGDRTLAFDPWVFKQVQKAMEEYPEIFEEESPKEEIDAALPVPPEDGQPVQ